MSILPGGRLLLSHCWRTALGELALHLNQRCLLQKSCIYQLLYLLRNTTSWKHSAALDFHNAGRKWLLYRLQFFYQSRSFEWTSLLCTFLLNIESYFFEKWGWIAPSLLRKVAALLGRQTVGCQTSLGEDTSVQFSKKYDSMKILGDGITILIMERGETVEEEGVQFYLMEKMA